MRKQSKSGRTSAGKQPATTPHMRANRLAWMDTVRSTLVIMMIAYHFCFDLSAFGWARFDMNVDTAWLAWRAVIVSGFLALVGIGLRMSANASGQSRRTRLIQIGGGALLASLGSWISFPDSFIYFGILHFIFVASLPGKQWGKLGIPLLAASGGVSILAGYFIHLDFMNPKWINWIGFASVKPITEDYVPLFPWIGVVMAGVALGAGLERNKGIFSSRFEVACSNLPDAFRWLGRHSLIVYLVHQPILFGFFELAAKLRR